MLCFFLLLDLIELVFIEFLGHSCPWLINVVVHLINEMRATNSLPLRLLGAQGSNFSSHHVKIWSVTQASSKPEVMTECFCDCAAIEETSM